MTEWAWAASVDELLRLPKKKPDARDASYRSDAMGSLRGRWLGRYAQPLVTLQPVWMDLVVDVRRESQGVQALVGEGNDALGRFTLEGSIAPDDPVVRMMKRYVAGHSTTNLGLFTFHHEDVFDRVAADALAPPAEEGFLAALRALFFYRENPIDMAAHAKLVERFFQLRPELRPVGTVAFEGG